MSGICEIFPDDESCQVPEPEPEDPVIDDEGEGEEEEEEVADEEEGAEEGEGEEEADAEPEEKMDYSAAAATATADWQRVKDMSSMAMMASGVTANVTMALVAASWAASGAMEAFRYRSASTYYDAGKVGTSGTNWWKTTDQIRNYSSLAIGGILALTSLASAFGGQTLLNAQAWGILSLVGGLVGLVVDVMRMIGYDSYYSDSQTTATAAAGAAAMALIKTDAVWDAAASADSMIAAASVMEGWYADVWNALTDEEQADEIAAW